MKKVFIGALLVLAVGIGWFVLNQENTYDYVAVVSNEVEQLETELAEIDAAVEAGTLSPEEATTAKVKILTRLDTINTSVSSAQNTKLGPQQKTQLADGLNRLKNALIDYQMTLSVVEEVSVDTEVKRQLSTSGRSSSRNHVSLAIVDTIENVEDVAEAVIDDYEPSNEAEVAEIEAEAEAEETGTGDEESMEMPTMDDPSTVEMTVEEEVTVE